MIQALLPAVTESVLQIYQNATKIVKNLFETTQKVIVEAKGIKNFAVYQGIIIQPMKRQQAEQIFAYQSGQQLDKQREKLKQLNGSSPYLLAKIDEAYKVLSTK